MSFFVRCCIFTILTMCVSSCVFEFGSTSETESIPKMVQTENTMVSLTSEISMLTDSLLQLARNNSFRNFKLSGRYNGDSLLVSVDNQDVVTFPKTITFDFGDYGYIGDNFCFLKGKILVTIHKADISAGSMEDINLLNFSIDERKVNGTVIKECTNVFNSTNYSWKTTAKLNFSSNQTSISSSSNLVFTWLNSNNTTYSWDDLYSIVGSSNSTIDGLSYSAYISNSNPLILSNRNSVYVSGTCKFTWDTKSVLVTSTKSSNKLAYTYNAITKEMSISETTFSFFRSYQKQMPSMNNDIIAFNPHLIYGTLTDIDGNVYRTIKIGNQIWMAENLRVTKYRNGEPLKMITDLGTWKTTYQGACCAYEFNSSTSVIQKFGYLYNGYSILSDSLDKNKTIAPSGWHIPTPNDFFRLKICLNTFGLSHNVLNDEVASSLAGTTDWTDFRGDGYVGDNLSSNNSSGFTALPSGYLFNSSYEYMFLSQGTATYFWLQPEVVWVGLGLFTYNYAFLSYNNGAISFQLYPKNNSNNKNPIYYSLGLSVRCVKNE